MRKRLKKKKAKQAYNELADLWKLAQRDYTVRVNNYFREHCEHGKGVNDYCEPCGRANGG